MPVIVPLTLGTIVVAFFLNTLVMLRVGFDDAELLYGMAAIFPLIITPLAALPLVIMAQRLHRTKDELEQLLRVDGLTEIPNRRAFFERATAVFTHDGSATVMMIDVDHFKAINDRYGHAIGDAVLSAVGRTIAQTVSTTATGGVRITARIGGEEFAVLVEELDEAAAALLAERILDHIRMPVVAGDHTIPVTASIGIAQRRPGYSIDELLQAADSACYRAKRLGRDRWCRAGDAAERPQRPETRMLVPLPKVAAG